MWGSAAKARNEGARRSRCPVIVFLDDDVEVECKLLEKLVRYALKGFVVMLGKMPIALSRVTIARRDIYFSSGGFNERIVLNQAEDIDFMLSCLERGYRVLLLPPHIVGHREAENTLRSARRLLLRAFNGAALTINHFNLAAHYVRGASGKRRLPRVLALIKASILPPGLGRAERLRALLAPILMAAWVAGMLYYTFRLKILA